MTGAAVGAGPGVAAAGGLLAAEGLAIARGAVRIAGITFAVEPGQCWFVLGRNGSGKTTLVLTLLGLLPATAGRVRLAAEIADRSALGFAPQDLRLPEALPCTVAEFTALGLCGLRLPREERQGRVRDALQAMQIGALADAPLLSTSIGQRRRVLVARALCRNPRLLVLDEPTANLDPPGAAALCADIERLRARDGLSVLHVSHDLHLARRFATHVLFLEGTSASAAPAAHAFADSRLQFASGGGAEP